jgi:hypothetical protein
MLTYKEYAPSTFDTPGLGLPDRQDWLVVIGRNRDSDCADESNFAAALERLGGESETVEVHRFGHWACGWIEIIIVAPEGPQAVEAYRIEDDLDVYPLLDENDHSEREAEAAVETWRHCYSPTERIAYIRANRSQFEFRTFSDMLGSVRGLYFGGYDSEMAGP